MAKDRSGGPARKEPEKVVRDNKYPAPKRGQLLDCLSCTEGKIMSARGVIRNCNACHGTGKIKV